MPQNIYSTLIPLPSQSPYLINHHVLWTLHDIKSSDTILFSPVPTTSASMESCLGQTATPSLLVFICSLSDPLHGWPSNPQCLFMKHLLSICYKQDPVPGDWTSDAQTWTDHSLLMDNTLIVLPRTCFCVVNYV